MTDACAPPADRLGAAAALAEQGFLAAGQSLEAAVGVLDRLASRFAGYVAELTGEALTATRQDLAMVGSHVAALAEARAADAVALQTLGQIAQAAAHHIAALLPLVRQVETLSLSARVVAGGMGDAAADFLIFAGDIRAAAQHARASVDEASRALQQVAAEQAAARTAAAGFVQRHGAAMQAIPARLADNARSLQARQSLATDAAAAARRQSEAVGRQVAQQIVALQLGDITRQRLEHVQAATQQLSSQQQAVGALLAAQLADTAGGLEHGGGQIEDGLHRLVQAARAIGLLGEQVHGEAAGGSFIAALEADLRQTAVLFFDLSAEDAANDRRMTAVLDAAGALAARLASVQSVQEDIRIMGLNASLKCGRLGTLGRPLAAVAQELRLCSGQFGTDAAAALRALERLRPIATGLCDPSRHGRHAELAQTTDGLVAPLRRLHQLECDLAAALAGLQQDAADIGRLVDAAVAQFGVRHALVTTLRDMSAEFAAWPDDGCAAQDTLDRIAAGYTMAREREVHARFAPLPQETAEEAIFF